MSDPTAPGGDQPDAAVDRWLADSHAASVADLGDVLDVEAGLREAMLPGRHAALVADLGDILDVEAGLAEIVPTPALAPAGSPGTQRPPTDATQPAAGGAAFVELHRLISRLDARDVRVRLRARSHRSLIALGVVLDVADPDVLDRAVALALMLAVDRARARALIEDLAVDLAIDLAIDLAHARVLASNRHGDLADTLAAALTVVRDLTADLDPARSLARALTDARNFAYALARALTGAEPIELERVRDLAPTLDLGLPRVRDLVRDLVLDLALPAHLVRDLDPGLALARALVGARDSGLPVDLVRDLDRALALTVDVAHAHARDRTGELAVLRADLDRVRDDFTGADLRAADLDVADASLLEGLRWSVATQWPPGWLKNVRRNSVEVAPGVFEVRGGGGGIGVAAPWQAN